MPAERAPMRKVREVLRLRHALGVSERQIAITTDSWRVFAARRRHRHQLADAGGTGRCRAGAAALHAANVRRGARPLPDWSQVHKELKRPAVTLLLPREEYGAEHTDGYGNSRFCDLYRDWRKTVSPTKDLKSAAVDLLRHRASIKGTGPASQRAGPFWMRHRQSDGSSRCCELCALIRP